MLIITVQQSDTYIYTHIYTFLYTHIHSFYIHIIIYIIYMQIIYIYTHTHTFLFKTILCHYCLSFLHLSVIIITFNSVCLSFCHLLFLELNFWVCVVLWETAVNKTWVLVDRSSVCRQRWAQVITRRAPDVSTEGWRRHHQGEAGTSIQDT